MKNSNKLIVDFLGKEFQMETQDGVGQELQYFCNSEMQFDKWNWLMEVVSVCFEKAEIFDGSDDNVVGDITHALLDCDEEKTLLAVVNFIDAYNKLQTTTKATHNVYEFCDGDMKLILKALQDKQQWIHDHLENYAECDMEDVRRDNYDLLGLIGILKETDSMTFNLPKTSLNRNWASFHGVDFPFPYAEK
jgi:hypothetical protein